jgi:predicted nucleic acid-binding protein
MIIAAVAQRNDCTVVTDNQRDFAGLGFITRCGQAERPD